MAVGAFRPWLPERILTDDDALLVVDKPSGLEVHGGDERLRGDVVSRLAAELERSGRDPYLGVHQRLDVGTSGVLLFVRDRALNAAVAADFEGGRVVKRYVAAVEVAPASALARTDTLELVHRLAPDGKRMRVVRRDGKECRAVCRVLERKGRRALVELRPLTGRTHQLRVQLAAVGAPIGGDRDYGGARCPRLLLHAESLELPGLGRRFTATVPPIFRRFLAGDVEALGDPAELRLRLADAACRRFPLLERTEVLRWVNGWGDELAGVVVDWYRGYTTLSVSSEEAHERRDELAQRLVELGAASVYLKVRRRADLRRVDHAELAPPLPVLGTPHEAPLVVREGPLAIAVALGDGLSTGLFLDQRENRQRVFESSGGAAVLNLFAYTGSFSVAAALGGAERVVTVDLSRRALERARENFRLNGLDPTRYEFVQLDAARYLERARARGARFDWIVLDPPSFSSEGGGKSKVFRAERDYAALARAALALLGSSGRLLAVTNHRGTSRAALRAIVSREAQALGRAVAQIKELRSPPDFPDGPEGPEPSRAVLLTLGEPKEPVRRR